MKIAMIRRFLRLIDSLLSFVTFGKLETRFERKFLVSSLDNLIAQELDNANKIIDQRKGD